MISCVAWVPRGRMAADPEQREYGTAEMRELIERQENLNIKGQQINQEEQKKDNFSEDEDTDDEENDAEGLDRIGQYMEPIDKDDDNDEDEHNQYDEQDDIKAAVVSTRSTIAGDEDNGDAVGLEEQPQHPMDTGGSMIDNDVPDPTADGLIDELNMSTYDDEAEGAELFLGGHKLTVHNSNTEDPYITVPDEEDEESDEEDEQIKPTDSVLIVGRTEEEHSAIEVYIYDEDSANLFVHHDFQIPSFPLCSTWLDQDPRSYDKDDEEQDVESLRQPQQQPGSFLAVGTFLPGIEIWNLDVLDALEPVAILGGYEDEDVTTTAKERGKHVRKLKSGSHSDAILCLGWHPHHKERLVSGSADETVKLWDITTQQCTQTLTHHQASHNTNIRDKKKDKKKNKEKKQKDNNNNISDDHDDESWYIEAQALNQSHKVQSLHWNPNEPSLLLTGSYDRTVHLIDVRVNNSSSCSRVWTVESDVEQVRWHPSSSYTPLFLTATESGLVYLFDARQVNEPIFRLAAHSGATTAIGFNHQIPSLFLTAGADRTIKLWDIPAMKSTSSTTSISTSTGSSSVAPTLVISKEMKVGSIWSAAWEGDSSYLLACGGDKGKVAVWDIRENTQVARRFQQQMGLKTEDIDRDEAAAAATAKAAERDAHINNHINGVNGTAGLLRRGKKKRKQQRSPEPDGDNAD